MTAVLIVVGYAALIAQAGWVGAAVAALHVGVLLVAGWRPPPRG